MSTSLDQPGYNSGRTIFIVITGIASVMVVLALALAWVDSKMLNEINDYKAAGLSDLPPNNANPEELLEFANAVGIECVSIENLFSGAGACSDVLDVARTVNDYKSDNSVIWASVIITGIALVVTFAMFIHRASSNLQHLRIAGQKFTPGWAVGWFFIPFMNIYKPTRIVGELSKASGSTDTKNPRAWQNAKPQDGFFISSWWTLVIFAILFGPRGISLFVGRGNIEDWAASGRLLVLSDLFQVLPLVLTVIVVSRLQRAQEFRHQLMLARRSRAVGTS
jgi:heme/copper-type cytochrome/quinol oxidase subunit 2